MATVYESRESSSPMITRAVAAGLGHTEFCGYEFSGIQRFGLDVVGAVPQRFAQWLIPHVQSSSALDPSMLKGLTTNDLVEGRLLDYSDVEGLFPAVVVGVGMGGSTTHLSVALQAPFLPQAFVMTLKKGSIDGNVHRYLDLGKSLAKQITDANPDLMSIQHYDPIHDGWLVRHVNHLRLKLTEMPDAYKEFIRSRLKPGGEVIYLSGQTNWLRYRLGTRNVFQVGGWGDIPAEEFLNGSERIREYCRREGLKEINWRLDEFPVEEGPESEWGSEPGLKESLQDFCRKEGYRFVEISYEDPNDFSRLAFRAIGEQFKANQIAPVGVIVETFSQYDPTSVIRYGLLPIWLIYNTGDSLRFLQSMRRSFLPGKPILFSGLSTFSLTPDMVKWQGWKDCFEGFEFINIGSRPDHYPADTQALVHWQKKLHRWGEEHVIPAMNPIDGSVLERIAHELASDLHGE